MDPRYLRRHSAGRSFHRARTRRRLVLERLEARLLLDGGANWGPDIDWSDGDWGVKVTDQGTPGSATVNVSLPGGTQETGQALEVYYALGDQDKPQFWVFLTDGFFRQVSRDGTWGTSGRMFRYYSSSDSDPDKDCDTATARQFQVVGVNLDGNLQLSLDYDNDSSVGDRFDIHAAVTLLPPDASHTTLEATLTVTNTSGRDVVPAWQGHRELAEQWELLGLSSMYVADNLTGGLPAWYEALDPDHDYVGVVNDSPNYLNDGYSVQGQVTVSTHDTRRLVVGDQVLDLAHDSALCPPVAVPGLEWYQQLVLLDQPATDVRLVHAYDSARNQRLQVLAAAGLTDQTGALKWAVTYNRDDRNLVDGDNVQVKLGLDDFLNAWPADAAQTVQVRLTSGGFPFTKSDGQFWSGSEPVFLNGIGYQPLEPGQDVSAELRLARLRDDLLRWEDYQGGGDPVVLRLYPQPTASLPQRLPQEFYDGVRQLGFWILRDIFVPEDILSSTALDRARQAVDAVLDEVLAARAVDRIFAWEIGNEFLGVNNYPALTGYLTAVRDYIRQRLLEPAFAGASSWVTWAAYPGKDLLRTDGNRVSVAFDYYSVNAYPYDPERIRDHQPGPVTGTPYEGYLAALVAQVQREYPGAPVLVTEAGLADSDLPVADNVQPRLHPWYAAYRKGGLNDQQLAEGLADLYVAARLSGEVAGLAFFEWSDEWWKAGDPSQQNHAEEAFGLGRFEPLDGGYELRYKLAQETVRDLFQWDFHAGAALLTGLAADATSLPTGGSTTVRATLDPTVLQPVRFRWESSRGRIIGDSDTVQFFVGNAALGPANVTCVAIDAAGRAQTLTTTIDIQDTGEPLIEIFTLGAWVGGLPRVSGRVANVDLAQYQVVLYIETDNQYVQPYADAPWVFAGTDGYWWSWLHTGASGEVIAWVVPRDFVPTLRYGHPAAPDGTIAEARWSVATVNDSDNDLLPDSWETTYLGGLTYDRYGDSDGDLATNLEEYLAGRAGQFVGGGNPAVADNDRDGAGGAPDGLPDNWEYQLCRTLQFGSVDDPDGDGLTNAAEFSLGLHPGRTAPDRDRDALPDLWEQRYFGNLGAGPADDPNGDGVSNLLAYELGLPPHSYFHAEGSELVRDATGEKLVFRGVNLTGLEYGAFFNYPYPGQLGTDYFPPRSEDFDAVQARGFNLVRVPFEWARLVPGWSPGDALPTGLEPGYLGVLDQVVQQAGARGLYVVLDMHDFFKYWSGRSAQVQVNASPAHQQLLAQTWRLLAAHFAGQPAVLGYDLMNEPIREGAGSSQWHAVSQLVVEAIRQEDRHHLLIVEGPDYAMASYWPADNPQPWITDLVTPPRVVYSPHVYLDYGNDSQYDGAGEDVGPAEHWEYYVRDRLLPAIDWADEYDVPLLFGEIGAPSTALWREVVDRAFRGFFEPLRISVAAWHYIDPARNATDPLNLARFPSGGVLDTLDDFPGGTYTERGAFPLLPPDSLVYDDQRVNPWHYDGSWGAITVNDAAVSPVCAGEHSISVQFPGQWGGLKFQHQFGLNTSRFQSLRFCLYPTSSSLDFTIFTLGPLWERAQYPLSYGDRHRLSEHVSGGLVPNQWQVVEIPLSDIVSPDEPVMTAFAFQDDAQADAVFYLDEVSLVPATLIVTEFVPTDTGFVARFNRALEPSVLNLYDSAAQTLGPADVTVTGATVGPVRGSLVVSADQRQMAFVRTGGLLEPDTYTVTLFSGATRFREPAGGTLDGNADGTTGDNYQTTFTVAARPGGTVTISLPDLARGAGQPVNVPNPASGLPIRLDRADGVTSLAVDLVYDPALLQITAATLAAGLPADWNVVNPPDTSTPGVAKIRASGTTLLTGTNVEVVRLTAAVPGDAPYGAIQAVRLENVSLNNGTIAAVGDVAVHKAVYLGDADGSGIHSSADAFLTVQAALGLASGFSAHAWTDPRIVGDADGSGVLSAADAFLIVQEGLGLVEPFVPNNPHIGVTPVGGGVDPQFQIDVNVPASVGSLVSVPVMLDIEAAASNVGGIDFELFFDPAWLTIDVADGVLAGADTEGWAVSAVLVAPGQLRVGTVSSRGQPLAPGRREIAWLVFHVAASGRDAVPVSERPGYVVALDIEPVDSHAGGYTWTASDGSLLIGPALPSVTARHVHDRVFSESPRSSQSEGLAKPVPQEEPDWAFDWDGLLSDLAADRKMG